LGLKPEDNGKTWSDIKAAMPARVLSRLSGTITKLARNKGTFVIDEVARLDLWVSTPERL